MNPRGERNTIRPTDKAYSIQPANGIVELTRETEVYINAQDTSVYTKLVEDSPAVSSLGLCCKEPGYFYMWNKAQQTNDGVIIACHTENYFPLAAVTRQKRSIRL